MKYTTLALASSALMALSPAARAALPPYPHEQHILQQTPPPVPSCQFTNEQRHKLGQLYQLAADISNIYTEKFGIRAYWRFRHHDYTNIINYAANQGLETAPARQALETMDWFVQRLEPAETATQTFKDEIQALMDGVADEPWDSMAMFGYYQQGAAAMAEEAIRSPNVSADDKARLDETRKILWSSALRLDNDIRTTCPAQTTGR